MNLALKCQAAGIIVVGVVGSLMSIVMPVVLDGLIQAHIVSPPQAALVASAEMIGISVSLVCVAPMMATVNRRFFAATAIIVMLIGQCTSIWADTFGEIVATRILAGLGEGAMIASMSSAIAAFPIPERLFAIYITCNMVLSLIVFKYQSLAGTNASASKIFSLLAFAAVSSLIALPAFPAILSADPNLNRQRAALFSLKGLVRQSHTALGLCGTLAFFTGIGLVWPMVATIGKASFEQSSVQIADALALSVGCGAIAGVGASWLGLKAGRRLPLSLSTLGVVASTIFLAVHNGNSTFAPIAAIYMASWVVGTAFYMGFFAAVDPAGRLSALGVAMQASGLSLGPALASLFLATGSYEGVLWFSAALCGGALAAMLAADSQFRRKVIA